MSFVSTEFIVFSLIVIPLFFRTPQRWRWLVLLVASYIFYSFWKSDYLLLIVFSTAVDYFVALRIHNTHTEHVSRRRLLLTCSIIANLSVLFIFKYANLFSMAASDLAAALGIPLEIGLLDVALPVGISFYTFQSMAYTIDVYRGLAPHRHLGEFATYVALFPQLVAGPIERATHILPQFAREFSFEYERIASGLRLVLWGAFKKLVIADRLAIYVDVVYADIESYTGLTLIIASFFLHFKSIVISVDTLTWRLA